jgi:hypothetical protein
MDFRLRDIFSNACLLVARTFRSVAVYRTPIAPPDRYPRARSRELRLVAPVSTRYRRLISRPTTDPTVAIVYIWDSSRERVSDTLVWLRIHQPCNRRSSPASFPRFYDLSTGEPVAALQQRLASLRCRYQPHSQHYHQPQHRHHHRASQREVGSSPDTSTGLLRTSDGDSIISSSPITECGCSSATSH